MIPVPWKNRLKGTWKRLRLAWLRRRHGFGPDDLRQTLRDLGIRPGDALLVHSALDRLECFTGKLSDILTVLQECVGEEGVLLMPTLPFPGSALEWVRSGATFDLNRTPSRSGLLTELFRRSPGVIRSPHPTHATAIWGSRAAEFARDHAACATPCGRGSPYAKLLEADGKILFLGAGIASMTFFHTVEELLEPRLPRSPFTRETFTLAFRNASGETVTTTTRLFDPELSRRRRIARVVPMLRSRRGGWRHLRMGSGDLLLLNARDVRDALMDMAMAGEYCYDL
ncbi:MAG: AAC(3) family N-acetyltransferase [Magnetococcales bacterium]|nr:AAC(3) family N-acetyltransferase [Magnetococcales bacterium]